ncbi:MAG TPA: DUF3426 domain-containing protein [Steroidobacteraceae bacterium]
MFTVCPKCALTLVVTAADLRVAQGYVRCGRCSNVFNALARLSDDRNAGAKAQSAAKPPATSPATSPATAPGTATTVAPAAPATPTVSAPTATLVSARSGAPAASPLPSPAPAATRASVPAASPPAPSATATPAPVPPPEESESPEDSFTDDSLEFHPDSTDVNKVFVEQPPSAEFTAATGTFHALRLGAEHARPQEQAHAQPASESSQVDVELDRDLLAAMAENHPTGIGTSADPKIPPEPLKRTPVPPSRATALGELKVRPSSTAEVKSLPPPRARAPTAAETPMAARAKARADVARASLESSLAIRSAFMARKPVGSPATQKVEVRSAAGWTAGCAVLGLLLSVQLIHHYRDDLAATAAFNGPLTAIYSHLGIPLVPRWNLGAYEVRQLGASTAAGAPGQITVRASVKNGAHQPQPLPLLRVTLQDRFGNRIAARDVPPQSYLPHAVAATSLLSSGQRVDAEMAFIDPGSNAVGFEVDACLPAPGGGIACANDGSR